MGLAEDKSFLEMAGIFFDKDEEEGVTASVINLNDAMYWGVADGEDVPEAEIPELARLYNAYGWCGVLYWASKKRGMPKVEFLDVARFIEFVQKEEQIRVEIPDTAKRAYEKRTYTIGAWL